MSIEREKMTEQTKTQEINKEKEEPQKLLRLMAGYGRHASPKVQHDIARAQILAGRISQQRRRNERNLLQQKL